MNVKGNVAETESGSAEPAAGMSRGKKIGIAVVLAYVAGLVAFGIMFGFSTHKNEHYSIVSPFKLETWVHLVGPLELNKGVLYLLITTVLTIGVLVWVARRMNMRPNLVQTGVELLYDMIRKLTKDSMDDRLARRWFPFIFTLFVFILVTNLLGYVPLPVNSAEPLNVGGVHFPSFQIYAADTNVAVPLILAFGVFIAYNFEGLRAHGLLPYIKSLVPSGIGGGMLVMMYPLEILSHFLRLLSLTVRLWANLLAGHMLIGFMAGDLAVLLGSPTLGWLTLPLGIAIYLFECVLIAGLQAFIFSILTAIYLGSAVESH